jgi:radical SAM superfamily enzyme YgiQ (UPF0313 family)
MRFLLLKLTEEWEQPGILGHPPNTTSTYPPLGLLYIGAVLENEGHNVEIIDLGAESLSEEQLKKCLTTSDAVGISVYTNNYKSAVNIARIIKELDPKIPLIIGGPHCTFLKQQSLNDIPYADIAVELEGEAPVLDIVQYLNGEKKLNDINGIYYKQNNEIKSGKPFKLIKDMDSIPFPARHLVDKYDYGNFPWEYHSKKKFASMITSRGCPFHCRFCSRYNNAINGYGFSQRSAENVVKEIQEINDKYDSVAIVDDCFLTDIRRSHKIFDMLIDIGTDVEIMIIGARVDSADENLYKKMKKAGVTYMSFGIESGNQDILDYYNKKITLQQIKKAVKLGREIGFFLSASLIFGAPIETEKHLSKTIKFVSSLPLDIIVVRPFYYDLGAEFWNEEVRKGSILKDEYVVRADSNRGLGNLTTEEIDHFIRKAYKRFYLSPRYELGQVFRVLKQHDICRLKSNLKIVFSSQLKNIL